MKKINAITLLLIVFGLLTTNIANAFVFQQEDPGPKIAATYYLEKGVITTQIFKKVNIWVGATFPNMALFSDWTAESIGFCRTYENPNAPWTNQHKSRICLLWSGEIRGYFINKTEHTIDFGRWDNLD